MERLLARVEEKLFDPMLTIASVVKDAGIGDNSYARQLTPLLGDSLTNYIKRLRIETAARMLDDPAIHPGFAAEAVGIPYVRTFLSACKDVLEEAITPRRSAELLGPSFNYATWNRARRGRLSTDDVRALQQMLKAGAPPAHGLPIPDHPFEPGIATSPGIRSGWRAVMNESIDRILHDASRLPPSLSQILRHAAGRLCDPELTATKAQVDSGIGNTALAYELIYYFGDSLATYLEKRRTEIAVYLLAETDLETGDVAGAVGLQYPRFLHVFKRCMGELPRALRKKSSDAPGFRVDYPTWRRAVLGELSPAEVTSLAVYLGALCPEAWDSGTVIDTPPPPSETTPPVRRIEPRPEILEPSIEPSTFSAAELRACVESLARDPRPSSSSVEEVGIVEDWDAMEAAAAILARDNHAKGRREAERLMASCHAARRLYRIREIQCEVTAAMALERGELPGEEFWVPWLKVRAQGETWRDVSLEEWQVIEERLAPPEMALERWREADAERCRILKGGEIETEGRSEGGDYLLARVCLNAEEYYHRGTPAGFKGTQLAVQIAERLFGSERFSRHHVRRGRQSVLVDLLALAYARHANVLRYRGDIPEAKHVMEAYYELERGRSLSPLSAAQAATFHSHLLADEGSDLNEAESLIDLGIRLHSEFDIHQAAKAEMGKAMIQRLRKKDGYIRTLQRAVVNLDSQREAEMIEVAQNNYLYYLIREGDIDGAVRAQATMSPATVPLFKAIRLVTEGCLNLALGNLDLAEKEITRAVRDLGELERAAEIPYGFLYLAVIRIEREDVSGARLLLETASVIAHRLGLSEAVDIQSLVEHLESAEYCIKRAQSIAFQIGGCLGPEVRPRRR